jgi:N-acetylated-alpha-linked acidic dipeptidase
VQFLSLGPGDPSTPGWPSQKNGKRLPIDPLHGFPLDGPAAPSGNPFIDPNAPRPRSTPRPPENESAWERQTGLKRREYFAAIPSLPISYDAARPILEAMGGSNVPEGAQGGLPFAYHTGPGPAEVRLAVTMDYKLRPIWNVIARLEGAVEPERWVMLGNHRDAWTYGASDPGSGTAATLEVCRALGEAVKAGWKPRRTVVYASWDGEEYGLLGSTEWAEEMAESLQRKAVLMLNVDAAVSGRDLSAGGTPSLRDLFLSSAAAVADPRSGRPLAETWTDRKREAWSKQPAPLDETIWSADNPTTPAPGPMPAFEPDLEPLGSGSDYTAFVDHLGIPAMDVDFGGRYGVYHSIYDDFFWMEKFGDPEFLTHATAARLYTRIAMRAAGSEVVPFTFGPYARWLRDQVDDLRRLAAKKSRASGKPLAIEGLPAVVAAVRRFNAAATAADSAVDALRTRDDLPAAPLAELNDALTQVERAFLHPGGLPGRPWFRHQLVAPGLTTGYAAWTLPALRQAVQHADPAAMASASKLLAERIEAAAAALERVPALASPAPAQVDARPAAPVEAKPAGDP